MIHTLLLDIDDTLLDFTLGERTALAQSFALYNLPFNGTYVDIYHTINIQWWARYDRGEVDISTVIVQRFVELFSRIGLPMPLDFGRTYEQNLANQHAFIRGAKGFLQRLRPHYALYAVSNGRDSVQCSRLRQSGLAKMLDGVFTSEPVGYHKPEKGFFDYVAAHIEGYTPATTLLVGDSLTSDIAGGVTAGVHTVWFNRTHRPLEGNARPDAIFDNYHDIETYIRTL